MSGEQGRKALALYLQSRISEVSSVDLHPGARQGKGLLFDHATSIVIGEPPPVENDFPIFTKPPWAAPARWTGACSAARARRSWTT